MPKTFKNRLKHLILRYQRRYKISPSTLEAAVPKIWEEGAISYTDLIKFARNRRLTPELRQAALTVLFYWSSKKSAPLAWCLVNRENEHPEVLVSAWHILMNGGVTKRQLRPLINMLLNDPDPDKRHWAAISITWADSHKHALDALMQVVNNRAEFDYIRGQAAEALGYIGDKRALPALLAALEEDSVRLRWDVVFALGAIADLSSIPILEQIAVTDQRLVQMIGDERITIDKEARDAIEYIHHKISWRKKQRA